MPLEKFLCTYWLMHEHNSSCIVSTGDPKFSSSATPWTSCLVIFISHLSNSYSRIAESEFFLLKYCLLYLYLLFLCLLFLCLGSPSFPGLKSFTCFRLRFGLDWQNLCTSSLNSYSLSLFLIDTSKKRLYKKVDHRLFHPLFSEFIHTSFLPDVCSIQHGQHIAV